MQHDKCQIGNSRSKKTRISDHQENPLNVFNWIAGSLQLLDTPKDVILILESACCAAFHNPVKFHLPHFFQRNIDKLLSKVWRCLYFTAQLVHRACWCRHIYRWLISVIWFAAWGITQLAIMKPRTSVTSFMMPKNPFNANIDDTIQHMIPLHHSQA